MNSFGSEPKTLGLGTEARRQLRATVGSPISIQFLVSNSNFFGNPLILEVITVILNLVI